MQNLEGPEPIPPSFRLGAEPLLLQNNMFFGDETERSCAPGPQVGPGGGVLGENQSPQVTPFFPHGSSGGFETHSPYTPYSMPNQPQEIPPNEVLTLIPPLTLTPEVPMLSVQWPSWPHWVSGYPLGAQIPNLHVPGYPTQGLSVGGFPILGGEGGFALGLQSGLMDSGAGGGSGYPPTPRWVRGPRGWGGGRLRFGKAEWK